MTLSERDLTPDETERRRRRLEVLETLSEAAALRARLHPRREQAARARALVHARTTRG